MDLARYKCARTICLFLLGSGVALAQHEDPALEGALTAEIEANPEPQIREILASWASPELSSEQLEAALRRATPRELLRISRAESYEEVDRILGGEPSPTPGDAGLDHPLSLGDTDRDLVFTPVSPCRIFDTRFAGGVIAAGGTREFYAYGVGDVSSQGGNGAGCASPRGEPRAVHLNLAVLPQGAQGNARVYPADAATPTAAFVNFEATGVTGNSGTVKNQFGLGPREIEIFVSSAAHVIGDIMGYYYHVDDLSSYHTSSSLNNASINVASGFVKMGNYLTFNKVSGSSKVEVVLNSRAFSGTFSGASGVRFQVRLDDQPPDEGHDAAITTSNSTHFISILAVFDGVSAGNHTVSVWARTNSGTSTGVLLDPGGWGGRIVVKETF